MRCFHRAASRLISAPARSSWVLVPRSSRNLALPRFSQPLSQYRWNSNNAPDQPEPLKQDLAEKQDVTEQQDAPEKQDAADEQAISNETIVEAVLQHVNENSEKLDVADEQTTSNEAIIEAVVQQVNESSEKTKKIASQVPVPKGSYAEHYRQKQRVRWSAPEPKENVFVGGLFYDVTAEDLRRQMEKYGVVERCYIIHDSRGVSRGFGYAQFDTIDSARRAIEAMNERVFEGRLVTVQFAQTNNRPQQTLQPVSRTLYIGNLAFEMTDRDLNALFKDIDNVIDVRVSVDRRTGRTRGFAHAEFTNPQSATKAFEILSKMAPYGRKLRVNYAEVRKVAPSTQKPE